MQKERDERAERTRARLYGWWYVTIGLGFLLLSIRAFIVGDKPWLIALRMVIAAGYGALGYIQLRR